MNISLSWSWMGYEDQQVANVRELYEGRDLGTFQGSITLPVDPFAAHVLRIVPINLTKRMLDWRPWWEATVMEEMKKRDSPFERLMRRIRGPRPPFTGDTLSTEGRR